MDKTYGPIFKILGYGPVYDSGKPLRDLCDRVKLINKYRKTGVISDQDKLEWLRLDPNIKFDVR